MKLTNEQRSELKKMLRDEGSEQIIKDQELTLDEMIEQQKKTYQQSWKNLGCGYGKKWNTYMNEVNVRIP